VSSLLFFRTGIFPTKKEPRLLTQNWFVHILKNTLIMMHDFSKENKLIMTRHQEDCIHPNDTVYVGSGIESYHDSIVAFCQSRGIAHKTVAATWPRNAALRISSAQDPEIKDTLLGRNVTQEIFPRLHDRNDPRSVVYQARAKNFAISGMQTNYSVTDKISLPISSSRSSILHGGEAFNCVNNEGKRKVVISEKSLVREMFHNNPTDFPTLIKTPKHAATLLIRYGATPSLSYLYARSIAKQKLAEQLLCDKSDLVIIPTYSYDIDMSFAYLGNGLFFAHSYLETMSFYDKNRDELEDILGLKYNYMKKLILDRAEFIDKIFLVETERKFKKHGLTLFKGCGYLGSFSRGASAENAGLDIGYNGFLSKPGSSFLMNGLAFYNDASNEVTYLSLNSSLNCHKQYFSDLMKQHGVIVEFSSARYQAYSLGGLRCATNTNLEDISPSSTPNKNQI
jgi:hypothetical protein